VGGRKYRAPPVPTAVCTRYTCSPKHLRLPLSSSIELFLVRGKEGEHGDEWPPGGLQRGRRSAVAGIGASPEAPGAVRARREREMASDDAALDVFEGRSCGSPIWTTQAGMWGWTTIRGVFISAEPKHPNSWLLLLLSKTRSRIRRRRQCPCCEFSSVSPRVQSLKAAERAQKPMTGIGLCSCESRDTRRDMPSTAHPAGRRLFVRLRGDWRGSARQGTREKRGGKTEDHQFESGTRRLEQDEAVVPQRAPWAGRGGGGEGGRNRRDGVEVRRYASTIWARFLGLLDEQGVGKREGWRDGGMWRDVEGMDAAALSGQPQSRKWRFSRRLGLSTAMMRVGAVCRMRRGLAQFAHGTVQWQAQNFVSLFLSVRLRSPPTSGPSRPHSFAGERSWP
jgi:hypothetical protein